MLLFLSIIFFQLSCSFENSNNNIFDKYNFNTPNQFTLSSKLNEISGLASSSDGNLYAMNDEYGIIFKLNPENGKVMKRFIIGSFTVEADFEGLASAQGVLYAITSNGTLYKIAEGKDNERVKYEVKKLPFSSNFNIEGLCYDDELKGLVIACKDYSGKKFKNHRAFYFYSLVNNKLEKEPLFTISLKGLKNNFGIKDFYPSGIEKHPNNGNYFIISARGENVLLEADKSGNVIGVQKLKEKSHRQPEGITFLKDQTIIISDEAAGKKPTITKYILNN